MATLPGNRHVQWNYIQKHIDDWGLHIKPDIMSNYMSVLLPNDDKPAVVDGWLDCKVTVQIMHGQHRKLVLESVLASHAKHGQAPGPVTMKAEPLTPELQTLVHGNGDAWWTVFLYGKGMSCVLKSIF